MVGRTTWSRLLFLALLWGLLLLFRLEGRTVGAQGTPNFPAPAADPDPPADPDEPSFHLYMPFTQQVVPPLDCSVAGEQYGSLSPVDDPAGGDSRPAASHPDLNLAVRGYRATTAFRGLVDYGGDTDYDAPQLPGLFADHRTATFRSVYRVYDWDWSCNCRGKLLDHYPVTLGGMATTRGETIHLPDRSGSELGGGYKALVLYAAPHRITLKYTREDSIRWGYALHIENICVEPSLLALYNRLNTEGRQQLPALRAGQAIGRAFDPEIKVAVRDTGTFMDPRSRKDWWAGRYFNR